MLVLSRKIEESINIGDDITVKIIRLGTKRVIVGIDCDRGIKVLRSEIKNNNQEEI